MSLDAVEVIHRIVGYPLAFVVGPWALATFAGARGHRTVGLAYAYAMTFLYVTGTALTLTRHPWDTWEFGRNVTFNLLGYSLLLHGVRAMQRRNAVLGSRQPNIHLDTGLMVGQAILVAIMAMFALQRSNSPMHVFTAIGITLVALDVRDWRAGLTAKTLYRRHVRYILGSYFYVLTVVSIVHLRDELTNDTRWLWPSLLGVLVAALVGEGHRANKWAIRALLAVSIAFGAYVGWEVARDHGQVERVLGVVEPLLDARDEVEVEAMNVVAVRSPVRMAHERTIQREAIPAVAGREAAVLDPVREGVDSR
jgi:hypothetical protein